MRGDAPVRGAAEVVQVIERRIENTRGTSPGGSIRASDAEREQVITALQQHFVDGRITDEELSERIDYLLQTRTRAALVDVTRDLPPLSQPAAPETTATDRHRRHRSRLRHMPVAPLLLGLFAVMFLLPSLAVAVFGGPRGAMMGAPFPPLLTIFIIWLAVRLAAGGSRWR
jgi:hypothetical protein